MFKTSLVLAIWLGIAQLLIAQDPNSFQPLEASGKIPQEFLVRTFEKYQQERDALKDAEGQKGLRVKDNYLLSSNYVIDDLLLSGRVLFNDPLTNYVNEVADFLLKEVPELRKKLRFYTVKSSAVNAFTTDKGIIFVNVGLIAHLENEAQLAFTLAHEIQHYLGKHSMRQFEENVALDKRKDFLGENTRSERYLAKCLFSKEQELIADDKGYEMYANAGYSQEAVDGIFDLLSYSSFPYDSLPFDYSLISNPANGISESLKPEKLIPIKVDEEEERDYSTHPSIGKRRKAIREKINTNRQPGKPFFQLEEKEFYRVRDLARMELSYLFLKKRQFVQCLYNSNLLLVDFPDNFYLEKKVVQTLYSVAKIKGTLNYHKYSPDSTQQFGDIQVLDHIFLNITRKKIAFMALSKAWGLHEKYPEDQEIRDMADDLMEEVFAKYPKIAKNIKSYPATETFSEPVDDQNEFQEEADSSSGSEEDSGFFTIDHYDAEEPEKKVNINEDKELLYSCWFLFENKPFVEAYHARMAIEAEKKKVQDDDDQPGWSTRHQTEDGFNLEGAKKGWKWTDDKIDKLVLIEPYYEKFDKRKKEVVRFIDAEKGNEEFIRMLQENAALNDMDLQILDFTEFDENSVEDFRKMNQVGQWVTDWFVSQKNDGMIIHDRPDLAGIAEKYGTPYFGWTGLISLADRPNYLIAALLTSTCCGAPIGIPMFFTPRKANLFVSFVMNVETEEVVFARFNTIRGGDNGDKLQSLIYDNLLHIKLPAK